MDKDCTSNMRRATYRRALTTCLDLNTTQTDAQRTSRELDQIEVIALQLPP